MENRRIQELLDDTESRDTTDPGGGGTQSALCISERRWPMPLEEGIGLAAANRGREEAADGTAGVPGVDGLSWLA